MNNKDKYIKYCKIEPDIPIFSQPWWLDVVCGAEKWNVILIEQDNRIIASFPYYYKVGRWGMRYILKPVLTQKLGPYIKYPEGQKYEAKLAYEKQIISEIIALLPEFDYFDVNFDITNTNWLPWYWHDFQQTTRYSYRIDYCEKMDQIVNNFSKKNRQLYRRGNEYIEIVHDLSVEDFYATCEKTFLRQKLQVPYTEEMIYKIFKVCQEHNCGKPFFAIDKEKKIHSVSYEIWDQNAMYSVIGGGDPALRNNGEKNMIFFEAIRFAMSKSLTFDFEGSMIEPIENFYRAFGAIQTPYFRIYKQNTRKCKLIQGVKNLVDAARS